MPGGMEVMKNTFFLGLMVLSLTISAHNKTNPQGSLYSVPVTCHYKLYTWVDKVLLPTMKLFNTHIKELRNPEERMTNRRINAFLNEYGELITEQVKTLETPSDARTEYLKDHQDLYNKVVESMNTIKKLIYSIFSNTGRRNLDKLKAAIEVYEKQLNILEEGAAILSVANVTKMNTSVAIPPKYKGWIDVRPACNKLLDKFQSLTIDHDQTTYTKIHVP